MRILIFGTFDELHPGHRFFLQEAAGRGEVTVVVARDANVLKIKGRPAVQSEDARRCSVQEVLPKATVIPGDPRDFLVPVLAVQPDLILLGYDQGLPPGVTESDLPCPVERLPAHRPEKYKSSVRRKNGGNKA